ncbi:MAG: LysM peptidoglycan-binding domain-containing protein [Chloroflexota bacterium]
MMNRKWAYLIGSLSVVLLLASCVRPTDRVENPNVGENGGVLPTIVPTTAPADDGNTGSDEAPEPPAPTEIPVEEPADGGSDDATGDTGDSSGDDGSDNAGDDTGDDAGDSTDGTGDATDGDSSGGDGEDGTDGGEDNSGDSGSTDGDSGSTDGDSGEGEETDGDSGDAATTPTEHVVQAGENLYRIGLQYGLSFLQIAEANNIASPYTIAVGQTLTIPGSGDSDNSNSGDEETTYVVKAGDTLYSIGVAQGVSWIQIAEANGLSDPNRISPGDTLKIPVSTPGPSPQFSHTVKANETLYSIAVQYGVSWTAVAAENNISSPYIIFPGSVLNIPGN